MAGSTPSQEVTPEELEVMNRLLGGPKPGDADWKPIPLLKRSLNSLPIERGFDGFAYDSKLDLHDGANADLTLFLRIFFQRVDPTANGGRQSVGRDGNGTQYKLEEIADQEFNAFRIEACRQANAVWKGICLVTPNDFPGFDWPKGRPTIRPNVNCSLRCSYTENANDAHVTVKLVAPSYPKNFISATG